MPSHRPEPVAAAPKTPAPAVGRAFDVLALLAREQVPLGVSQIAAALGFGKASVHALVHALAAAGALELAAEKKYRLGPILESLAACRKGWGSLEATCRPLLERLAAELGQTAVLGIPDGDRLRLAAVAEGGEDLRIGATPGLRIPLFVGAHGKLLAAWGQGQASAAPPGDPVREALDAVVLAGVAFDRGEYLEGVVAAAAPVLGPSGRVLGVLYVVGLGDLMGEEGLLQAGEAVRRAASLATRALA